MCMFDLCNAHHARVRVCLSLKRLCNIFRFALNLAAVFTYIYSKLIVKYENTSG